MSTIWERRDALQKERRDFQKKAMADFDRGYYRRLKVIQDECGLEGHNWNFTHLGPLGHPWFSCGKCHKSEVRSAE
jgi:hypothetical protein